MVYFENGEVRAMKKDVKAKLAEMVYKAAVVMSGVSANSTCLGRYYQEKESPQLNALRKYHDK